MRIIQRPQFGMWTVTVYCDCGLISVLDMHAFKNLRIYDLSFDNPVCLCGQYLLDENCQVPDELWHLQQSTTQ